MILTINGLHHYNENLFSDLLIPDSVDKKALIGKICSECASYEVIYPDAYLMQELIGYWSTAHIVEWQKLAMIIESDFNPLDDYRHSVSKTESGTARSSAESESSNTESTEATSLNRLSAYDSNDMENREQNDDNQNTTSSGSASNKGDSAYNTESNVVESGYRGNVAVLIQNAIKTYETANIYEVITKEFKKEFCILCY